MAPSNLIVRNYQPDDLPHVLELYDYKSIRGPHFVRDERLLEYLIHYSEAQESSIFVAAANDEIKGWVIVSIEVGERGLRFGNIVELEAKDVQSMHALIEASHKYSTCKDVDAITMVPPRTMPLNGGFRDWLPVETGVMMARILSFSSLLQVLLGVNEREIRKHFAGKRFVFRVEDEIVEMIPTAEKVEISETDAEPEGKDIVLTMSAQNFLKVVFGGTNLLMACLTGKIKVRGMRNIITVLKLLRMLRITDRVYVSNADRL